MTDKNDWMKGLSSRARCTLIAAGYFDREATIDAINSGEIDDHPSHDIRKRAYPFSIRKYFLVLLALTFFSQPIFAREKLKYPEAFQFLGIPSASLKLNERSNNSRFFCHFWRCNNVSTNFAMQLPKNIFPHSNAVQPKLNIGVPRFDFGGIRHPNLLFKIKGLESGRVYGSIIAGLLVAGLGGWVAGWGLYRARRFRAVILVGGCVFGFYGAQIAHWIFGYYIYDWVVALIS